MKRNLLYLVLLLAAAGAVYLLVKQRGGTLDKNEQSFAIADTAAVGRLFIADMQGNKVDLTRTPDGWLLNGRQPASKPAVDLMLSTLQRLAVRYPVPDATRGTVIKEMAARNRKVMVYNRDGELMKTMYIGDAPLDYRGSYMLIDGAANPYVVEVPGFQGTLDTRFITDSIRVRDAAILSVPFNALMEVSVVYREQPDSSFAIDMSKADSFRVFNPVTNEALSRRDVDKNKIFAYVNLLKRVNAESYESHSPVRQTVLAQRPFAVFTVKRRDGSVTTIECYDKPTDRRSKMQFDTAGAPVAFDVDRFYGLVDGREFVLLQHYHFGQLLRNIGYFRSAR